MRARASALAFGILSVVLFAQGLRAQAPPEYVVRDIVGCLNVREAPNTDAAALACLDTGTRVVVLSAVPYWRSVRLQDGREGWAAKAYLELVDGADPAAPAAPLPTDQWLEVHFVDVAQGDAIWIHTPDDGIDGNGVFEGRNIIIDGGPYSADARNPLFAYLEERGHHQAVIDALIVTHPHTDHFKGAETISRHFRVRDYYDPGYPSRLSSYAAFLDAMQGTGGEPARADRIHLGLESFGTLDWGSEVKVEVLHGWSDALAGSMGSGNTEVNNSSIVLRVSYGSTSLLLMGDAEGKDRHDPAGTPRYVEDLLLRTVEPAKLRATVLKVGHHGSETSSTLPFIRAVDPAIVIVQSGRKSFSGTLLPDASTLTRYCCHHNGIRIYRTDQGDESAGLSESEAADGDHIVVRTNGTAPPTVEAYDAGTPHVQTACEPSCGD